jgi:hypothetical protein
LLVLSFQTFSLPISGKTYLMEISAMKRSWQSSLVWV